MVAVSAPRAAGDPIAHSPSNSRAATRRWSAIRPTAATCVARQARLASPAPPSRSIPASSRYDGLFALRTNARITPLQAVLRYRDLLQVENLFRRAKAILRTRPIYHSSDGRHPRPCVLLGERPSPLPFGPPEAGAAAYSSPFRAAMRSSPRVSASRAASVSGGASPCR